MVMRGLLLSSLDSHLWDKSSFVNFKLQIKRKPSFVGRRFKSLEVSLSEWIEVVCVDSSLLDSILADSTNNNFRVWDSSICNKPPRPYSRIRAYLRLYTESLTLIEFLSTNTRDFQAWMLWNIDLLFNIVGSWHPERQSSVVDQRYCCKV